MKVFISWSGARSKQIAEALHWWLPNVIQSLVPFISTRNIAKGARGLVTISENLEQAAVGIICLTPENREAPWILFESGALSKITTAHVCTFLFGIEYQNVEPPLSQFQHTLANEEEILDLLKTINLALSEERRLSASRLEETFKTWWPQLAERLQTVPSTPPANEPVPPERTEVEKLDELLQLVRSTMLNPPSHKYPSFTVLTNKELELLKALCRLNGIPIREMNEDTRSIAYSLSNQGLVIVTDEGIAKAYEPYRWIAPWEC